MTFDANLVLVDGSADWTYANIVTSNYGSPDSLTRNAGGFVVIDLLALGGTPAKGITIVLILPTAAAADDDALTLIVQASDNVAFGSAVNNLADFDLAAATSGIIVGSEAPCTVIRRVATTKRYLRVDASCVAADNFKAGQVLINPWAFDKL